MPHFNLPDELMLIIFHLLTWVPYRIKPINLVSLEYEAFEIWETGLEHEHKCLFKLSALRLVCKSWYSLLVPVLYDWIALHRHERLGYLRDTLKSPPMCGGGGTTEMGWYTKRLDLAFKDDYPAPQTYDQGDLDALVDIIQALPKLEVFTIRIHGGFWNSGTHERVLEAITPKLKVISCHDYRWRVRAGAWDSFVASHPNLVAINQPVLDPDDPSLGDLPFELLEHCCLYGFALQNGHIGWLGSCPSLQRLSLEEHGPRMVQTSMRYASTLTALQFNTNQLRSIPQLVQQMHPVILSSPNLTRLDVISKTWLAHAEIPSRLPQSISLLGIRVLGFMPRVEGLPLCNTEFLSDLVGWDSPKPAMIQFLDDLTMDCILVGSADIVTRGRATSWLGPGGELIDLKSVKDLEEFGLQARKRVETIEFRLISCRY